MISLNVKDEINAYIPYNAQQMKNKEEILKMLDENDRILYRDSLDIHFCSSGFIMDETLEYCLMVYHNIYKSFAWTGGHNDGEDDMLKVAIREAQEETGITKILKVSKLLRLDILPVVAHIKNGKPIKEHYHINGTYLLIADRNEAIRIKPDENSDVKWLRVEELDDSIQEKDMLILYKEIIAQAHQMRKNGMI